MRYRLIAMDLDGTLLNRRHEITPRTREALAAARARGIVTVIATGRSSRSAYYWSRASGGGPVICCNGAAILDETGAMAVERGLPPQPLRRVLTLFGERGILTECYTAGGILLDRPLDQVRAYLRWVRPNLSRTRSLISLVRLWRVNRIQWIPSLVRWAGRPDRPAVLKVMALGGRGSLDDVARQIRAEMPGLEVTSSSPGNLEITAPGVSKAAGLEILGARLRIPRDSMIAIGDSENDLGMIRYAGMGVAMGNAIAAVKAAADHVTATCDEDGVARALEELCLQDET